MKQQAIEILDEMIKEDKEYYAIHKHYKYSQLVLNEAKSRIQSLPDTDEWISADNPPEEVQMKQILAYEIDERR